MNWEFKFEFDPATSPRNYLDTSAFLTPAEDGHKQPWPALNTFINPPYSQVGAWGAKADKEFRIHNEFKNPELVIVMLVASRRDSKWSHDIVIPAIGAGYCRIVSLKAG